MLPYFSPVVLLRDQRIQDRDYFSGWQQAHHIRARCRTAELFGATDFYIPHCHCNHHPASYGVHQFASASPIGTVGGAGLPQCG